VSLEQEESIGGREMLRISARALRYVRPFWKRFAIKLGFVILSLLPGAFMALPAKVLIDHVIRDVPLDRLFDSSVADAVLAPLAPLSENQVLALMIGLQLLLIVLVGALGTGTSERDRAQGELIQGQDDATVSEERANEGDSYAGGLLGLLDYRFMMRLTQDLNHHYRAALFRRIQQLPMPLLDDERIGDAVYRVMYDTPSITRLAYWLTLTPISTTLQLAVRVGLLVVLYPAHQTLAIAALLFGPLTILGTLPLVGVIRRSGMRSRAAGAVTTTTIEESSSNMLAVQSLGLSQREKGRFDRDSWNSFSAYRSYVLSIMALYATSGFLFLGMVIWVFRYITDLGIRGEIQQGDYLVLFNLFLGIVGYARSYGSAWIYMQVSAPGLKRVFFLMDLPSEEDRDGARELEPIRSEVELRDVDFDYSDGTPALRDVSLRIPVGQVTALCGPAGAGKTTLAYMIPRFLAPTRGVVRADGVDVAGVTRDSLRSQVAFVFQEMVLFDASVRENLQIANPSASETELVRACKIAGAHEFIQALPQGYDTRLGRMGGKLSVGQKQRLSIARALVRDANVLILDEPTSALDPATERDLVTALREASRDRAVIVIAHRLSTIRTADRIAFLREGRIVECGTHAELMARPGGGYRRFVELQTRGVA
jgi:ABC-type multidrug transport system fused ATPase/permease subunit